MSESEKTVSVSLDRAEGEVAVLVGDDGAVYELPLSALPGEAREGACYRAVLRGGALCSLTADAEGGRERRERISHLFTSLKNKKRRKE